ncbi:hypothetical protein GWN63_05670 [Candidatus Bathyarchaeota archaeon]|nr:hypothetical protein [Candidatus Bathyarchaeota archaeon]NIU81711.1 hypothetical protein [Candidatus Bathyarchaeota archaeon]NIV68359.1 hypothetical protein [Candidatus Bathyarchaeota archaeon]NIW16438.1 hypothetical protein [Candidatus Bathyarchaeota archaeon]NIW34301.1 hypothetical protein [Candidatus Bathyarchaeota archaeon]
MRRNVERGRTLLVDGPASVNHISGEVEVLAAKLRKGEKVVIREGKRLPFLAHKKATVELTLGEDASFEAVEGSTIPSSWEDAWEKLTAFSRPSTVMVVGEVDSGKSSFCTYLLNHTLRLQWRSAILDADLGQSDVGPPSTIGLSHVKQPIKDLFEVEAEQAYFVGSTSPSQVMNRVMEGLVQLKSSLRLGDLDFLVINTDGWISGEEAVSYKVGLINKISPEVVVGIEKADEVSPILTALESTETMAVDSPSAIKRRSQEKRRVLRELGYKKYLKKAKVRSFPLSWVRVERVLVGSGRIPARERMERIKELLGTVPVYCEETPATLFIVLRRDGWLDEERITEVEDSLGKWTKVIRKGEEEGLLVGLHGEEEDFLGIGVLVEVDYRREVMKVYTPVSEQVSSILLGDVRLNKSGKEIGWSRFLTEGAF